MSEEPNNNEELMQSYDTPPVPSPDDAPSIPDLEAQPAPDALPDLEAQPAPDALPDLEAQPAPDALPDPGVQPDALATPSPDVFATVSPSDAPQPQYTPVNHYDMDNNAPRDQKSRNRRVIIVAVLSVVLLLVAGIAIAAVLYVNSINSKLSENVTEELRDELVTQEAGEPFYLLLLGIDKDQGRVADEENYGSDEHMYRSDSIMLCRIDPKNVKVTMVSIHRDTAVKMDEHGIQKINAAYAFGGAAYATKTVSIYAGVPISHYAEIDLDRFIGIVDQVGGITVNLPVPVRDPEYTGLDLPAGEQTLDGFNAAMLCRCRHGYDEYGDGDVFRAANQRMVFSAVIKKVLAADPATIAATVATMADSVTTDMDVSTILDLAAQMRSLDVDSDISTGMAPTEGALIDGTWYEICLVDQWKKIMMRVDKGLPPYDEAEGEHDSTAGIAGGVGAEGERAAEAAAADDNAEAAAQEAEPQEAEPAPTE